MVTHKFQREREQQKDITCAEVPMKHLGDEDQQTVGATSLKLTDIWNEKKPVISA